MALSKVAANKELPFGLRQISSLLKPFFSHIFFLILLVPIFDFFG